MSVRSATWWQRNKFSLSGFILLLPFWFLYQAMNPQFPPALPKAQLGPYEVLLMPLDEKGPYSHHGEWVKDYFLQFSAGDTSQLRQGFLLVSASEPATDNLQEGESSLLHGNRHGLHVHARSPQQQGPDDKLWLLLQDWQGNWYRHSWPLTKGV